ncbi:hypothetical protein V6R85_18415 [Agrobacterium sp. CCNWLW32]|uniref:hypothetical protein n=1 Tax=Agrobacterium TaxID=357 RepID=UPI001F1D641F|nr:hypothetical protein [Agrobacterium tumefaciens]MBP2541167.1 hypothetical protein [Agrobacterium tumefaciens]
MKDDEFFGGKRSGKELALTEVDTMFPHIDRLLFLLDTFRNGKQPKLAHHQDAMAALSVWSGSYDVKRTILHFVGGAKYFYSDGKTRMRIKNSKVIIGTGFAVAALLWWNLQDDLAHAERL